MSPVNVFRPRGFGGGADQRFTKPFQSRAVTPPKVLWSEGNHGRMFANGVGATGSAFNNGAGVRAVMHANSAVSTFSLDPEA